MFSLFYRHDNSCVFRVLMVGPACRTTYLCIVVIKSDFVCWLTSLFLLFYYFVTNVGELKIYIYIYCCLINILQCSIFLTNHHVSLYLKSLQCCYNYNRWVVCSYSQMMKTMRILRNIWTCLHHGRCQLRSHPKVFLLLFSPTTFLFTPFTALLSPLAAQLGLFQSINQWSFISDRKRP